MGIYARERLSWFLEVSLRRWRGLGEKAAARCESSAACPSTAWLRWAAHGVTAGVIAAECQRSAQDILHGMGTAPGGSCTDSHSFATADYGAGWEKAALNVTAAWSYSPPDLPG